MYGKHMAAGLVATALLATSALAQAPSPTTSTSSNVSTSASSSSYQGNWRASKVVGLNVYNDGNESLGAINDLLTDKDGKIVAVIVGVGGFLGVGERYAAIPFDKVKFVNEPVPSSSMANNSATPGTRPTSSTSTTGAATGTVAPGTTTTTNPGAAPAPAMTASTPNPWYPDHAVISATKDELKAMAEFKYSN